MARKRTTGKSMERAAWARGRRTPTTPRRAGWTSAIIHRRRWIAAAVLPTLAVLLMMLVVGRWEGSTANDLTERPTTARQLVALAQRDLAEGAATRAERHLINAVQRDSRNLDAWRLRLEILRAEDRLAEAHAWGFQALQALPTRDHGPLLRALTLALLTEPPDDQARAVLERWSAADPNDVNAQAALLRRIGINPRKEDPHVAQRLSMLESLVRREPASLLARIAQVEALLDTGEIEAARQALENWPQPLRGADWWRLQGRFQQDHQRNPADLQQAIALFRMALSQRPHDAATRFRLARALAARGQPEEARREADSASLIRERLDPQRLGPQLARDLAPNRLNDPQAAARVETLARQVGLNDLADAWHIWREHLSGTSSASRPSRTSKNQAISVHQPFVDISPDNPRTDQAKPRRHVIPSLHPRSRALTAIGHPAGRRQSGRRTRSHRGERRSLHHDQSVGGRLRVGRD
ncbi:hypothetical protein Isop_3719 [Isosphaera pallida ATCC 43644]|uniref:Uncharacterized protein n=1 Tax=Isosphaera pallida (strain ATCC 43644 / DSM 9630 / IS1B) TaxID=575540 RepID=E8QZZ9_ISOPI|nr:tetratricopeptide repeat protein [Isosphaera pallida]ADV64275.1 hypothetical protein Isop_3719 [Isosphaera pallida ATCC 43644]